MKPVARLGDLHHCPLHGTNRISAVASRSSVDGRPVATVGDVTECGAVILDGSDACMVDGRPAATLGSTTSHGGVIETDSPSRV